MEPAPELVMLIQEYYRASARGDTAFLAEFVARDAGTIVIGTDDAEWWEGGDHIVTTWSEAWQSRGGLPVVQSEPRAFRAGDVGWIVDRAAWQLPNGRIAPFRLSAVVRHENGRWLLAHAHFSVGVPNDALGGEE